MSALETESYLCTSISLQSSPWLT